MSSIRAWASVVAILAASCGGPTGGADAGAPDAALPGACPAVPVPENTDALCRNGLDDDCNGYFDCFDFACTRSGDVSACCGDGAPENTDERCGNAIDDDCDGYTDCRDFSCSAQDGVTVCCGGGTEGDADACTNGWDDDCNGYTDCYDFSCRANNGVTVCCGDGGDEDTDAACSNGVDDDCNGFIDCDDSSCSRDPDVLVCCEPVPETAGACTNSADDDCDGRVDCDDEDCAEIEDCRPGCTVSGNEDNDAACTNGVDDDCDGYLDCIDFSCARDPDVTARRAGGTVEDCGECARGADCEGGACVAYPDAPTIERFCSRRCTTNADCSPALPSCGGSGYCGASADQTTRTCDPGGDSYTVRDGCGSIIRRWACPSGEECAMVAGRAQCQPPCVPLFGNCAAGGPSSCCEGLDGLNTLGSAGLNCICFRDDGAACGGDRECAPELSECAGGTCETCFRHCGTSADCCEGMLCGAEQGLGNSCSFRCDPSRCAPFCELPYGCCDQHCDGLVCVTDRCSFD